ncbi:MAG: PDZ domain-containing protein [Luteitalea sp.]|nr:PDZ domain-containing protein [Luteitalea sp.]
MSSQSLWQQLSNDIATGVRTAASSLVRIGVPAGRPATGLILAPDLVIAADHAVAVDDDLEIARDGQRAQATVVGRDPVVDLAVLRASGLDGAPLTLAEGLPQIGEIVVGVWRDWRGGLASASSLVAGLPGPIRVGRGTSLDALIRTTLLPARGMSGGALLSASGQVTGVLTVGLGRGTVVALPAETVRRAVDELQAHGRIRRGYVGVALQRVRLPASQRIDQGQRTVLLVVGVEEKGPAAHAEIQVGDLIVGCEGERLSDVEDLQAALRADRVGQPIALDLLRGGSALRVTVIVGERGRRAA